jgi:hypothetical protein
MTRQSTILWLIFAAFVAAAVALEWRPNLFDVQGAAAGKLVFWAAFVAFTGYSFYCTTQENLFATIGKLGQLHWGRQIVIDLYIGLLILMFVVWLNEASLPILLFWLVPTLIYGNMTTLLYFALNYEQIVAKLASVA